ncbi:hypothetical protein BU15DRAFT_81346 [Melanogaster broomeanus]|nr:hypothetical protein BU15DRAFT_81346 [Melanogaster broomeanus]
MDSHTRNNYDADLATPPLSQSVNDALPQTAALTKISPSTGTRAIPWTVVRTSQVETHDAPTTRASGPGATATSVNSAALCGTGNNSAPGRVKAECSNGSATHTPLWCCGLNDELNCNACGHYCKLHKRPRPQNQSQQNSHSSLKPHLPRR